MRRFLGCADQAVAQHILFGDDRHDRVWSNPCSSAQIGQMQPAFADAGSVRDRNGLGQTFILDQAGQSFSRTVRV